MMLGSFLGHLHDAVAEGARCQRAVLLFESIEIL